MLLRSGACATLADSDGMNALHLAVSNGLTRIVGEILKMSTVDTNMQDRYMYTALHYAAINDDVAICKALIESGASMDMGNCFNETGLHLAAGENNKNVIELLLNQSMCTMFLMVPMIIES